MIEAANKQIKYRFSCLSTYFQLVGRQVYHQTIHTFDELKNYMQLAVDDYNNRPYAALNGLTPNEVLKGKLPTNISYTVQTKTATQNRILQNKITKCCNYSF